MGSIPVVGELQVLELIVSALIQQAERVETGDRNLLVYEHVEYFDVPGRNYRRFYRNIDDYGPSGRSSYYRYQMSFDFSMREQKGVCSVDSANVYLDHCYTMPRWELYENARPRDRELFDDLYQDQHDFLSGYAQLSQASAAGMLADLRSMDDLPCENAAGTINEISDAWQTATRAAMEIHEGGAGTVELRDTVCEEIGTRLRRCRD